MSERLTVGEVLDEAQRQLDEFDPHTSGAWPMAGHARLQRSAIIRPPMEPLNVSEFEALARARMEPAAFDYYAGGAGDERTLDDNRAAFDRVVLRPRVLVDVGQVSLRTSLLGLDLALPILLAPTAFNRLVHPDGELAAARAG